MSQAIKKVQNLTVDLIKEAENFGKYFCDPEGNSYVSIEINGNYKTIPIHSQQFSEFIRHHFLMKRSTLLSSFQLRDTIETLSAVTRYKNKTVQKVWRRVAEFEGKLYIDRCSDDGEFIEITSNGWTTIKRPPVKFISSDGMRELPRPVRGGKADDLFKFFRLDVQHASLLTAFCLHSLQPNGPYPILVINGPKGAGKTTLAETIVNIIDPNGQPLKQFPDSNQDLAITLNSRHVVAFDNISRISNSNSDMLARIASGGGYSTRRLYSDTDEIKIDLLNPILLNGIPQFVEKPDLADRCLFIQMENFPSAQRMGLLELRQKIQYEIPNFLGALLDGLAMMLAKRGSTDSSDLIRMADFHLNARASESAFWREGTIDEALRINQDYWYNFQAQKEPLAKAIIEFAKTVDSKRPDRTDRTVWTGYIDELYNELSDHHDYLVSNYSSVQFGIQLSKISPFVEENGFKIEKTREANTNRTRGYRIVRV